MRLAGAAAWLLVAASALAGTATLKQATAVDGPNILVRDVVVEDLGDAAGALVLKPLGRPGSMTRVGADLLKAKLRRAPGGPWDVAGLACEVSATAQVVRGADIARFAADYLRSRLAGVSGAAGLGLTPTSEVRDLLLSGALVRMAVDAQARPLRGSVIVRVRLLQAGARGEERESASVPVSFQVALKQAAWVARRLIRKGEAFQASDLEQKESDLSYVQGEPVEALAELEGKRSRAQIPAGRVLTRDLVEQPPAVRRGDMVRLISRVGMVSVETSAKALRDAAIGDSLPVEVEGNKKQVQARCVDSGTVLREAP